MELTTVQVTKARGRVLASFDGHWVVIHGRIGKFGETRIPVHQIVGVEMHATWFAAMTTGRYIRFVTAASAQRGRFMGPEATIGARMNDPNSLRFRRRRQTQVIAFRDAVLAAISVGQGR